jgi:hypothetical protein
VGHEKPQDYIRIRDAMHRFSLSRTTLHRLRQTGRIQFHKLGAVVLIDLASLRAAITVSPNNRT